MTTGPHTDAENQANKELAAFHHDGDMTGTIRFLVAFFAIAFTVSAVILAGITYGIWRIVNG